MNETYIVTWIDEDSPEIHGIREVLHYSNDLVGYDNDTDVEKILAMYKNFNSFIKELTPIKTILKIEIITRKIIYTKEK